MSHSPIYHKYTNTIIDLLKKEGVWFDVLEHEDAITSKEANSLRENKYTLKEGSKALILKTSKPEEPFIQLVITGDSKFSNSKVRKLINSSQLSFASEEELRNITDGIPPGGVPPFGNLFDLKVYCDRKVIENEKMVFNCGSRGVSVGILVKDYMNIVNPTIVDIS